MTEPEVFCLCSLHQVRSKHAHTGVLRHECVPLSTDNEPLFHFNCCLISHEYLVLWRDADAVAAGTSTTVIKQFCSCTGMSETFSAFSPNSEKKKKRWKSFLPLQDTGSLAIKKCQKRSPEDGCKDLPEANGTGQSVATGHPVEIRGGLSIEMNYSPNTFSVELERTHRFPVKYRPGY